MHNIQYLLNKYILLPFLGQKRTIKYIHKKALNRELDIDHPVTFTDKIHCRKIERNKLYVLCADKIKVRDYVKKTIGEKYLIPVFLITKKLKEEDWNNLPDSFIVKTAHASGTNVIVYDKKNTDKKEVLKIIGKYQKINFAYVWCELFYKKIKPYVIVEKLLVTKNNTIPDDYKMHCFKNNGNWKIFIQVDTDRFGNHCQNFYDEKWKLTDISMGLPITETPKDKPEKLEEMIEISKKLAKPFEYTRVDLYCLNNQIYFGELTFTHQAGLTRFNPPEYNEIWGSYWKKAS